MKRLSILILLFCACAPRTNWEPPIPMNLSMLTAFARNKMVYKRDPVWGLLDNLQSIEAMNYQLKENGFIEGDCEDYAHYLGWTLERMGYSPTWSIAIPPYRHTLCAFKTDKGWRFFSNQVLYYVYFTSLQNIVTYWCETEGYEPTILWMAY